MPHNRRLSRSHHAAGTQDCRHAGAAVASTLQRLAERFADALESIEGVESGQDRRRVGALAALSL